MTTDKQIEVIAPLIEGNELICKFLGWHSNRVYVYQVPNRYPFTDDPNDEYGWTEWNVQDIGFDVNWNYLMPVVEKIQSLGFNFIVGDSNRVTVYNKDYDWRNGSTSDTLIECVWHGVVQFIKWYNQHSNI